MSDEAPTPDPLIELQIRDVLHSRLLSRIEDDGERWLVATAMANHLALAGLVPLPDGQTRIDGKVYGTEVATVERYIGERYSDGESEPWTESVEVLRLVSLSELPHDQ